MANLKYAKPERIWLKDDPDFSEKWLQDRIVEDPSILGLGDVVVIERERRQERGGRLDLLLADPEENVRYEVELMLGATDESHIVRTIEYWDVERRRYPGYDHCAVLVAEDITSRFLNVIGLLSGNIPIIAVQLGALKVGDQIVLSFVRVIDRTPLRQDDEVETKLAAADRDYWNKRAAPRTVDLVDALVVLVNEKTAVKHSANYNRYYIGLHDGTRSRNFVYFRPRKQYVNIMAIVSDSPAWVTKLEDAGLAATANQRRLRVTVAPKDFESQKSLIAELLHKVVEESDQG
jgi:hypothetical protein